MAGCMLIVAGLLRFGDWIKYIPEPVVTGFTAGIAVIIFTSQLRDLFGLDIASAPAEFIAKLESFWAARDTVSLPTLALSLGAIAVIFGLRKVAPKWPGFLIVVIAGAVITALLQLDVETIGSRFGGVPSSLPLPHLPVVTWERVRELFQPALTIAFLAGVESLLSAIARIVNSSRKASPTSAPACLAASLRPVLSPALRPIFALGPRRRFPA
jgi:SulP family sulfate permease